MVSNRTVYINICKANEGQHPDVKNVFVYKGERLLDRFVVRSKSVDKLVHSLKEEYEEMDYLVIVQ